MPRRPAEPTPGPADGEALARRLADPAWAPTLSEAAALRDHIAGFLQSDPRRAGRLAADFLRSVEAKDGAPPETLATAWRSRAEAHLFAGEYKASRAAYERACAFAARGRSPRLLGRILVGRIGTLQVMGEFDDIRSMARQAEALLRRSGDQDYLRRLHINLGSGHYHRERFAEAYASYAKALRLMERAGQRDEVRASLLLNFGIACSQLARVDEARRAFREVEAYCREHGLERLSTQAIFNQGALEALRGGYRPALRLLADAEEALARQEVRELLAATYLEQAQIYLDLSLAPEGRDLARSAGDTFIAEGMHLDGQLARLAEARSLLLLRRPEEAAAILVEAERFYRRRRIPARRAQTLLELARARLAEGDPRAAGTYAARALRLAERLRLRSLGCSCLCLLSELQRRRGRPAAAERVLRGVVSDLSHLRLRDRLEYWSAAARAARAAGDAALASRRYLRAIRGLEAQRALIPGLELRARSFEADVRVYHEEIVLQAASPRAGLDRLLRLMEGARGRTFREIQAARGGRAHEETSEMRAVLGVLVRRLDQLQMQGRPADAAEAQHLRRQILDQERRITARVRKLEAKHATAAGASALRGAGQIAELLRADEALIKYFVAEGRILAVVITRRRRKLIPLEADPAALRTSLDHLRLQLDSFAALAARPLGNLDFLRRGAEARLQEIYRLVLAPLRSDLPPRGTLTIIPHDLLHDVPFECLHDGDGYVDARWRIARCPTGDFLVARRGLRRRSAEGPDLVIAGTRAGTPFVEEEARRVHRSWGRPAARLLVDPSPVEAIEAMKEASLIHVSAHGSFRADNPFFSTLHLGREPLFLADILETRLQARLAVLSACNSGLTFSGRGDALLGVAHAFLAAGTERLVASLWRVHDEATAGWMESFHRTYCETQDAAESRLEAGRAQREAWPHPFYWGGFCVLGG